MFTTTFNPQAVSQIAIAIGVGFIAGIVTLALLYSGLPIFGPINDLTNAFMGLMIVLLVWQFHNLLRDNNLGWSFFLMITAWLGSAAIIINSFLVAFGQVGWKIGGLYTAIGYAMIGIWLLAMHQLIGPQPFLTPGLIRLGIVAAVLMIFGVFAGPFLVNEIPFLKNPLVTFAYSATGAGYLLFPVWCWLVGKGVS